VEFVIKMDCPYAVNELILMLGLVASEFGNERKIKVIFNLLFDAPQAQRILRDSYY